MFSLPFVVNFLLPEKLGNFVFYLVTKRKQSTKSDENKTIVNKFPAKYSYCFSMKWNINRIKSLGFSDAKVFPLYGHNYYKGRYPFLHKINENLSKFLANKKLSMFSSFAYTIVQK